MTALDWNRINAVLDLTSHLAAPLKGLSAELRDAMEGASFLHARRLKSLGVSAQTIAEMGREGGWGVINAVEHPSDPGLYCLEPSGAPHLLLPVHERGELIDLVAFRSSAPNNWLLRKDLGWALGWDRGAEPYTWDDEPTPVWLSPLEWLQNARTGVCVLAWDAPEVLELRDVPKLVCSSPKLALHLEAALRKPARCPEILLMGETHLAA